MDYTVSISVEDDLEKAKHLIMVAKKSVDEQLKVCNMELKTMHARKEDLEERQSNLEGCIDSLTETLAT